MPYAKIQTPHQSGARSRAFTALEMALALTLTSVIALCVYSMTGASGQFWSEQQAAPANLISAGRAQSYIERVLRVSQDVGYWSAGSPSEPPTILLWAHDQGTQQPDAQKDYQIQGCELVLLRYDEAADQLKLYRAKDWSEMTLVEQLLASELITSLTFNSKLGADTFAGASWVTEQVIAGAGAEKITSATWTVDRSAENPVVRFRFEAERGEITSAVAGVVSLRVRSADDDWSNDILKLEPLVDPLLDDGDDSGDSDSGLDFSLDLFP